MDIFIDSATRAVPVLALLCLVVHISVEYRNAKRKEVRNLNRDSVLEVLRGGIRAPEQIQDQLLFYARSVSETRKKQLFDDMELAYIVSVFDREFGNVVGQSFGSLEKLARLDAPKKREILRVVDEWFNAGSDDVTADHVIEASETLSKDAFKKRHDLLLDALKDIERARGRRYLFVMRKRLKAMIDRSLREELEKVSA